MAHFYYGRWRHENRRNREAAEYLSAAIAGSPPDLAARDLLMKVYWNLGEKGSGCELARETLKIVPADTKSAARIQGCLTLGNS